VYGLSDQRNGIPLTRLSAAVVIEILGWLGVPAMARGNVIEISTGIVGINEACSGIRSFQSSLMISLFLGEFYGLSGLRRLILVPLGFILSIAFNVVRMSFLTMIAAKDGAAAIGQYHDPAGVTITILCTLGLWVVAAWLNRSNSRTTHHAPRTTHDVSRITFHARPQLSTLNFLSLFLVAWLVAVEIGVQSWYRSREARLKSGPMWSLNFPKDNASLKDLPIDDDTRTHLRFDEGRQAAWTEADGTQWQGFYFSWQPGRVAGYLAKRHTPEICLAATGQTLRSGPELTLIKIHGVVLPIRSYVFEAGGQSLHVFHCRWEAGAESDAYVQHESGRYNLVRAIWAGRGNKGQKVLEFVIAGMDDPEQAKQALFRQLDKLISVEASTAATASRTADELLVQRAPRRAPLNAAQVSKPAVSPISNRQSAQSPEARFNVCDVRGLEALQYSRFGNLRYGVVDASTSKSLGVAGAN